MTIAKKEENDRKINNDLQNTTQCPSLMTRPLKRGKQREKKTYTRTMVTAIPWWSTFIYICCVDLCPFALVGYCVVCSSLIYRFFFTLWYFKILLITALCRLFICHILYIISFAIACLCFFLQIQNSLNSTTTIINT